ncbi:MAG: NAD(P)H-binding protein [Myxococcales bacterium]|nr:NAD(P)H-binding protein [Myxococcales bacterium]
MEKRRIFVAGSTGSVGRTVVRLAEEGGDDVIAHRRPKGGSEAPPNAAVFELGDKAALGEALEGVTTVIQLIGTMRKRFAAGDTYETSDIGTTRQLVEAARASAVDHFILLSSVGAGRPMGAYLKAKAEAERLVRDSGIVYTIFRPSFFDGEGHKAPPGAALVTNWLRLERYRPIAVETLAAAILACGRERAPLNRVLEGGPLWDWVEQSSR